MERPDIDGVREEAKSRIYCSPKIIHALCDYIKELEERIKQIKQVALGDFEKGEHHE